MPEILTDRRADGVAVVTISHPERRNAMTRLMWRALGETFRALSAEGARAAVLTGAGGVFCAGADISEFEAMRKDAAAAAAYSDDVDAAETAIHDAPMPVIAAIRGPAIGGGCGLAVACDFRFGDAATRMGVPAARLSIVYSLKETRYLADVAGLANAKRILFSGDYFDADASLRLGLLDEIVDDPMEAALAYAGRIAERAPLSVRAAKVAVNAIAAGEVDDVAADYAALQSAAAGSADFLEGQRAFMEKRPPEFRGR